MRTTSLTALGLAVLTALTATAAAGAAPADDAPATKPARTASVHGSARIHYAFSPDDDIRFTIDAEAAPYSRPLPGLPQGLPTDARGTVSFRHFVAATGQIATAKARVDCLVTGGGTATLTAVVTRSDVGPVGERLGFSVGEGRAGEPDRLGFSWGVANVDPEKTDEKGNVTAPRVGTCMAPAPFAPAVRGGFTVRHAELPPSPPAETR
ncbi:hypothetical protein [Streptomyces sp. CAI 127]|uniref:hypothetical protein n=1 Tax=Streptomyces sp. CAI 127 TaxID=1076397 RepID=UPI0015874C8A|nr:hypothetical protein [Streptomyces sp. CAI 127]NUV98897.1 hypothetical protein [Streptomyces sp. CAI 127]